MDVSAVAVDNIFINNRFLKIPFFQRQYVWNEDNWEQFYNDISFLAKFSIENPNTPKEKYFLGSIILKDAGLDNNVQTFNVIDGQQRLSTIVIFMKAVYLYLNRNDLFQKQFMQSNLISGLRPILIPNRNDNSAYSNIIDLTALVRNFTDTDPQMLKCLVYFVKRMDEDVKKYGKNLLINLIYSMSNDVRIVCIECDKSENEQKIFETINNEGTRLTTGDLLKNFLFDSASISQYDAQWLPLFEKGANRQYWTRESVEGRNKVLHIDKFLFRYLLIKMQEPNIKQNLSTLESKEFRQLSGVFDKFRKIMTDPKFGITKSQVTSEIIDYATKYKETFGENVLEEVIPDNSALGRVAYLMEAQNSWTMTPYILYIIKDVADPVEKEKIFEYLEKYLVRRMVCKCSNNNYSDLFSENLIGQHNNTYAGLKAYLEDAANRGNLLMPSDADVIDAVKTKDNHLTAKTILYLLESKINDKFQKSKKNNSYSAFNVEPFMVEKANTAWPSAKGYDEKKRSSSYKTLGNQVLLRGKLSLKQKKDSWQGKQAYMMTISDELMTFDEIAKCNAVWDEESVNIRNENLAQEIIKAWPI